jgi:chorismate mutase
MSLHQIKKIRSNIDNIDNKIIQLLGSRKKYVLQIAKYKSKKTIVDKKRINFILTKIRKEAIKNKIDPKLVIKFWKQLINYSIKIERKLVK